MKIYRIINFFPKPIRKTFYNQCLPIVDYLTNKKMIKLYRNFVDAGDLVFDVGANEGHVTRVLLDLGTRVVSVDPQPSSIATLKKRFSNIKNSTIVAKGVSNHKGELKFYVAEDEGASGVSTFDDGFKEKGKFSEVNYGDPILVEVTTLDELIKKYGLPKFCKIDVEGFEFKVLQGLSQKIPYISFEFTREDFKTSLRCLELLSKTRWTKFNYSSYGNYEFELSGWVSKKELIKKLASSTDELFCGDIFVGTK